MWTTSEGSYLDHIRSNESNTACPALWWVVEHVVHAELGVLPGQLVQILTQQDIVLIDIGKDEINLRLVSLLATSLNSTCDLQHRGDSCTTSNHTEVTDHVGRVNHGALGALDLHGIADIESSQMARDVTGRVGLHDEVEEAGLDVGGDGGVGAHDYLGLGYAILIGDIEGSGERDVLPDGQAEDVGVVGELEAVDGGVVRNLGLFGDGEFLEGVRVEYRVVLWFFCEQC